MKNATISIKNNKIDEEPIEVVYKGHYAENRDRSYVEYEESEMTGMEGTTTRINILSDSLEIIRKGTLNSTMKFKEGHVDSFYYGMEFGTLSMEISTDSLKIVKLEDGYDIFVKYFLEVKGNYTDENHMKIRIIRN